jgi:hypothetical protein
MSPTKPSEPEDEYFARLEFERRKKQAEDRAAALAAEERARLAQMPRMRCPRDGAELVEIEFRKVKIDKCVSCAGLWLDGGELEQVIGKGDFLSGLVSIFGKK